MKRIPQAVLVAATFAAGIALGAAPALARKEKAPVDQGMVLNDTVRAAAFAAKDAITARNYTAADTAVSQAEAAATTDDEKYVAALLRYGLASQKTSDQAQSTNGVYDPKAMMDPLDVLIANPRTPKNELPRYLYTRGTLAFDQKKWDQAIDLFTRAQGAGSTEANLPLYIVKAHVEKGDVAGGLAKLDALWSTYPTRMTPDYYNYAIARSYKAGLRAETLTWMRRSLVAMPTLRNWHSTLTFYGMQGKQSMIQPDARQLLDLYRLLRATHDLADETDYQLYAQAAVDAGLPEEARTMIAEGKANGKLSATFTPALAATQTKANAAIKARGALTALETKAKAAKNGDPMAQAGDIRLAMGEFTEAAGRYRDALGRGVANADEVNTHLGIALLMAGDKVGAKTVFATVTTAPRSDIAQFWTTLIDTPPAQ